MYRRKIESAEDARLCLDAAKESGLPRAEWARAHGVDARSLNAWRLNLERADAAAAPLRLLELVMPETADSQPPSTEYRVRCGAFTVEVEESFDDDVLARLLRVVATC